jgi:hypothetical protein
MSKRKFKSSKSSGTKRSCSKKKSKDAKSYEDEFERILQRDTDLVGQVRKAISQNDQVKLAQLKNMAKKELIDFTIQDISGDLTKDTLKFVEETIEEIFRKIETEETEVAESTYQTMLKTRTMLETIEEYLKTLPLEEVNKFKPMLEDWDEYDIETHGWKWIAELLDI